MRLICQFRTKFAIDYSANPNLETQLKEERVDRQKWEEDFKEEFDNLQDRYDTLLVENPSSAPAVAEFPEPADLLNQLKARRKKSGASLADVEAILALLAEVDGSS